MMAVLDELDQNISCFKTTVIPTHRSKHEGQANESQSKDYEYLYGFIQLQVRVSLSVECQNAHLCLKRAIQDPRFAA